MTLKFVLQTLFSTGKVGGSGQARLGEGEKDTFKPCLIWPWRSLEYKFRNMYFIFPS